MANNQKINYLFFDIGGVIADHLAALKKIANQIGVSSEKVIQLFSQNADEIDKGSLSWNNFEKILYEKLKPKRHLNQPLMEIFVNNFEIIQETHDFIYQVKDYLKVCLLSNVSVEVFNLIKSKNLIPKINYFAQIISGEIGLVKPQKEIFDYVINKINISSKKLLLIDDKIENIKAAEKLGWQTVMFETKNPIISIKKIKNKLKLRI